MIIRPIRTDGDYRAAMREISAFFDNEPEPTTPEGERFEILLTLAEAYEAKRFPLDLPDPVEAIEFRMEQAGLTAKDLEPMIGRSNRVLPVLKYQRVTSMSTNEYDCFFSYNSVDRSIVEQIASYVRAADLRIWLDSSSLPPGERILPGLETAIQSAACVAVFLGGAGSGPWQEWETDLAVIRERRGDSRVIPILLPGAPAPPNLPARLSGYSWLDLRGGIDDSSLRRLIDGIKTATSSSRVVPPAEAEQPPRFGPSDMQFSADVGQDLTGATKSRPFGSTLGVNEVEGSVKDTEADQVNIIGEEGVAQAGRNLVKGGVHRSKIGVLNIIGRRNN